MVDPRKRKGKHLKHKSEARHASQTNIQRSPKDVHGGKIEFDEIQKAAAGRHSVFDTRDDRESPSPRGLYEVKYSPERMSLLERVKQTRQ